MSRKNKHRAEPNIERWKAEQERRRSNVAVPHRNRKRYFRPDHRRPSEYDE